MGKQRHGPSVNGNRTCQEPVQYGPGRSKCLTLRPVGAAPAPPDGPQISDVAARWQRTSARIDPESCPTRVVRTGSTCCRLSTRTSRTTNLYAWVKSKESSSAGRFDSAAAWPPVLAASWETHAARLAVGAVMPRIEYISVSSATVWTELRRQTAVRTRYARRRRRVRAAIATLAAEIAIGTTQERAYLQAVEGKGLIVIEQRPGTSAVREFLRHQAFDSEIGEKPWPHLLGVAA